MTNITQIEKKDPLDATISSLVVTMAMDYGNIYKNQFQTELDVTHFKQRLRSKLVGLKLENIRKGYEHAALASPKYCPNAMQIVAAVIELEKIDKQNEKNRKEAERIGALPKPTITCNPMKMLRDAMRQIEIDELGMTKEEKREAHFKRLEAHNSLMAVHLSKEKKNSAEHLCCVSFCDKPGVLSNATSGNGSFYCREHFRPG